MKRFPFLVNFDALVKITYLLIFLFSYIFHEMK